MKLKKGIGILISLIAISILIPTGNILLTPTEASVTVTSTAGKDDGVKSLTIFESSIGILQGSTHELHATVEIDVIDSSHVTTASAVTWSSSDTNNKVTVDQNGIVSVASDAALEDYTITVTSDYDPSKSAIVTITVVAPPTISSNPSGQAVYEGENASFTVGASGSDLTYKWQVDTGTGFADISDGGVYSGTATSTLDITNATLAMNGYKYQVVINGRVSPAATSNSAVLTVNPLVAPSISSNPSGQTVYEQDNASFTVGASGAELAYQWQVDTGSGFADISDGEVYSGATTQALDITNTTLAMNGYKYQVVVSGRVSPAATSNGAVLTVNPLVAPSISSNPSNQAVYEGNNTSFTVGASGSYLTYKWQVDTGSGFTDIIDGGAYSGATTQTLDITNAILAMNGYKYQVVVSGKVSPAAASNGAVLTVNPLVAPSISSNPSGMTVNEGENASFTVGASGSDITYKWQVDTGSGFTDIIDGGSYSGATTQTLNITNATLAMNGYKYQVVVSGKASPAATSNSAVLTVTKKSGTSSGGSSSSGSSSSSSSSNTNTDSTANSTNTVSSTENLADNIIKSIGGEVKTTESIKTQNGGSAVAVIVSVNGKNATVVTTNVSDKVEVKAAAGENTVVYVYVKGLSAYMPVSSEVAFDKVIFTANPETAYVVADTNTVTNVVQAGWNKTSDSWCVVKEDGSLATGWYKDNNGTWYNLSSQGKMNTGWIKDTDGAWYYLETQSGSMKTGWIVDSDGKWYYLNTNGSMAYNTYIDGYRLGNDGAWIK